jgi:hypothetical protein
LGRFRASRRRRPPFNPEDVTREFATLVRAYNITTVHGDRFAAGWTEAAFARSGMKYEPSPLSKSEIYIGMLSLINSRQVQLPDTPAGDAVIGPPAPRRERRPGDGRPCTARRGA